MKTTLLTAAMLLTASIAWGESTNVSCKSSRSEYRLEIAEDSSTKLFYKGQANYGYNYQLDEIEVDGNLSCKVKTLSPLLMDCQSENEYLVFGRATGPEGIRKKIKANFQAITRSVTDETVSGKTTKVSNIVTYRTISTLGEQVAPVNVRGTNLEGKGEKVFELNIHQGAQDVVECSVL